MRLPESLFRKRKDRKGRKDRKENIKYVNLNSVIIIAHI